MQARQPPAKAPAAALRWLYGELPQLEAQGLLPPGSAARIQEYYGPVPVSSRSQLLLAIFGVIGALQIGGGVILLLAHNWDDLGRPLRTLLALLPLLAGHTLCAWTLLRRPQSAAWREASATCLALAIGASIALIGQTYQIPGETPAFLLTWLLLGLPVVYAMDSTMAALLYMAGLATRGVTFHEPLTYWLLLGLIAPFLWIAEFRGVGIFRRWWLSAGLCGMLIAGVIATLSRRSDAPWLETFSLLFAALYLLGARRFRFTLSPWRICGALGTAGIGMALALATPVTRQIAAGDLFRGASAPEFFIIFALAALTILLAALTIPREPWAAVWLAPTVAIFTAAILLPHHDMRTGMLFVFGNLYTFALAIAQIVRGYRHNRLLIVNAGILLLMPLLLFRFFDAEMSFTARGFASILLGIGFLAANIALLRRKRAEGANP